MKTIIILILVLLGYFYNEHITSIPVSQETIRNDNQLNEIENQVYEQIIQKIENYEITIIPNTIINRNSLNHIMTTIFNIHPEYFYLETSYSYKYSNDVIIQINLKYNELINDIENNTRVFNDQVNSILEGAKTLETDLDKEKYIHDYLIKNVEYDDYSKVNQSAFSALIYKSSVCAGYARAFQLLMNELDIPTYYCSGTTYGKHAWNIIYINNEYYNVDVTFNDSNNTTIFFNKNDAFFSKTHTRSEACKLLPKSE